MDNHPIPQDVTGFQFRLIGDMTIKQFAYLAVGAFLAWIFYLLPVLFVLKLPFILLFGGIGIILAFVPVNGRSADTMLLYFFKAVFSPTQYRYQQVGGMLPTPQTTFVKKDEREIEQEKKKEKDAKVHFDAFPAKIASDVLQATPPPAADSVPPPPTSNESSASSVPSGTLEGALGEPQTTESQLNQEAAKLSVALSQAKQDEEEEKGTQEAAIAHEKVKQLEDELNAILAQKQELETQLISLQKKLSEKKEEIFTPSTAPDVPQETEHVRKIPPSQSASVGVPLVNDVPNLLAGVVKDPRGNVLPNILIEVKDKDNNPVRAFKTNALGQFASATPLLNGVYTIAFEDAAGKQTFDTVEITVNGQVLLPLEIISMDAREELRRELFGAASA